MPDEEAVAVDELLRRADVAMYHAKARGKHRLMVYVPELEPDPAPAVPAAQRPPAHVRRNPAPAAS
jgi:hypothetical protein